MRISALLTDKGSYVATIPREATVAEAVTELHRRGVGALVVSPDGRRIDGIVSERDIVRRLAGAGASTLDESVESIMSGTVQTCSPENEVESLMRVMTHRRIRHVPVVAVGELCGIVSIGDVVKSRIGELEDDRSALLNYIGAR